MSYVQIMESTVYNFRFAGRDGPQSTGQNLWIQVKLLPEIWGEYRRAIVSDVVDYRSEEMRYKPGDSSDLYWAGRLSKQFVEKYYGEVL